MSRSLGCLALLSLVAGCRASQAGPRTEPPAPIAVAAGGGAKTLRLRGRVESPEQIGAGARRRRGPGRGRPGGGDQHRHPLRRARRRALHPQAGRRQHRRRRRRRPRADPRAHPAPPGLEIARDNSATLRTSIDAVREHLVLGARFAALTVLLFLGHLRRTIIASLAIPISLVGWPAGAAARRSPKAPPFRPDRGPLQRRSQPADEHSDGTRVRTGGRFDEWLGWSGSGGGPRSSRRCWPGRDAGDRGGSLPEALDDRPRQPRLPVRPTAP
jgi:hypothetical protein